MGRVDLIAPLGAMERAAAWEGRVRKKPWEYQVTATMAHLETPRALEAVVELLRAQTVRPYIVVVDTGSSPPVLNFLEAMRDEDLEIHYLDSHAYRHSSQPVAVASDLAMALCNTEFIYFTHTDCFLRRRDYLESLVARCPPERPVIGNQMSPRDHETKEWRGMVSHTATLARIEPLRHAGASWNIERCVSQYGISRAGQGWPDTETAFNLCLREHGIPVTLLWSETNDERQITDDYDHCRSQTGVALYDPGRRGRLREDTSAGITDAWARLSSWGWKQTPKPTPPTRFEIPVNGRPVTVRMQIEATMQDGSLEGLERQFVLQPVEK